MPDRAGRRPGDDDELTRGRVFRFAFDQAFGRAIFLVVPPALILCPQYAGMGALLLMVALFDHFGRFFRGRGFLRYSAAVFGFAMLVRILDEATRNVPATCTPPGPHGAWNFLILLGACMAGGGLVLGYQLSFGQQDLESLARRQQRSRMTPSDLNPVEPPPSILPPRNGADAPPPHPHRRPTG